VSTGGGGSDKYGGSSGGGGGGGGGGGSGSSGKGALQRGRVRHSAACPAQRLDVCVCVCVSGCVTRSGMPRQAGTNARAPSTTAR
jgi:hypothetical protein